MEESAFFTPHETQDLADIIQVLRRGREEVLGDWVERVRDNRAVQAGQKLDDPLLLNHMPKLFDAIMDRLEMIGSRDDAEQAATIHGFTRRLSGYNVGETVLELLMFRRAIWAYLTAVDARIEGAYAAMEQIDGMVDRAIMASLRAFLDPGARILTHRGEGDGTPEE